MSGPAPSEAARMGLKQLDEIASKVPAPGQGPEARPVAQLQRPVSLQPPPPLNIGWR
jgi:hypothetical protein